jgi:hypothetical protein
MKDLIFWGVLAAIAAFYLLKGNDMHREVWEYRKAKLEQKVDDSNKTLPAVTKE